MNIELEVIELKRKHSSTWQNKSDWFWALALLEEVLELLLALVSLHRGPVEWELTQISSMAMNWMEMRKRRTQ